MSDPRRSRAQARVETEAAILRGGREQLTQRGAAALSLREVARSLGMVSSAVYRYVDSRDALLTLLLVDAYNGLATDAAARVEAVAPARERLKTLAFGMRDWARAHPEQWGLIYGAPVPGYSAPEASTTEAGTRLMGLLLDIAVQGTPPQRQLPPRYADWLRRGTEELRPGTPVEQAAGAVEAWCSIVGAISMELFGQLGPELRADGSLGEEVLRGQVDGVSRGLGL